MIKTVTRFFSPLKGLWGKSILRMLCTILSNIITFVDIKLVADAVAAIERKDTVALYQNVYWLFGLFGVGIVINYVLPIIWNGMGNEVGNNIDKQFYQATTKLDNNRFERKGVGHRNNILNRGGQSRSDLLQRSMGAWTRYLVQFVGSFILLFSIKDTKIIGGGIIYYIVAVIMFVLYEKITVKNVKIRRNISKAWSSFTNRVIGSKFDILQSNKWDVEASNFDKLTDQFQKINFKQQFVGWLTRFPYLSAQFLRVVLYLYIGLEVISGQNSISQLIYITSIMWQIVGGADGIVQIFIDIADNKVNIKELWAVEDEFPTIKGYTDGQKFVFQSGKIEFKDVTFAYLADEKKKDIEMISDEDEETKMNKKDPVINWLNYIFEPGKKYAFVGPSGGGKSTIVKLISGYLMADEGQILIDEQCLPVGMNTSSSSRAGPGISKTMGRDTDIPGQARDDETQTISLASYYPYVGYLTQEPMVFDGTIRDNLMYGMSDLSSWDDTPDNLCRIALDLAHCDFVKDRENGLDTEIGEKGIKLSGGQRQRLALARIFLKNPNIIILDEPTSALDSVSEDVVTKSMNQLFEGKSVFIIAHRLQTVKSADQILFIENGQIAEAGTHDQLIKLGKKYAELVTLQATF